MTGLGEEGGPGQHTLLEARGGTEGGCYGGVVIKRRSDQQSTNCWFWLHILSFRRHLHR